MIRPLEQLLRAGLHRLPAETAHRLAIRLIRMALPVEMATSERVRTRLCGLALPHPVGLAAGFDKDAVAVDGLMRLGFAFVETGTSTLRPQAGNPRPRLFRLREDEAVINRMGFNNAGLDRYLDNLRARRGQGIVGGPGIVGGNVGINKDSSTPLDDYARALSRTAPLVDYVTINVSSPNTPGLRKLQAASALAPLLERLAEARSPDRPVLLKIAPDLHGAEIDAITDLAIEYRIDGMIVSNTTVARPESLRSAARTEAGGLSGRPLMDPSTEVLRQVALRAAGRIDLVGVGGVFDASDAYRKIRAGARAVQIYTSFVYRGPSVIGDIVQELDRLLAADGFDRLEDAIGADLDLDPVRARA